jgi:hypothetical protein
VAPAITQLNNSFFISTELQLLADGI